MKCEKCGKLHQSEEIKGTLGMKVIFCCEKVQVDLNSLRPKVRESVLNRRMQMLN